MSIKNVSIPRNNMTPHSGLGLYSIPGGVKFVQYNASDSNRCKTHNNILGDKNGVSLVSGTGTTSITLDDTTSDHSLKVASFYVKNLTDSDVSLTFGWMDTSGSYLNTQYIIEDQMGDSSLVSVGNSYKLTISGSSKRYHRVVVYREDPANDFKISISTNGSILVCGFQLSTKLIPYMSSVINGKGTSTLATTESRPLKYRTTSHGSSFYIVFSTYVEQFETTDNGNVSPITTDSSDVFNVAPWTIKVGAGSIEGFVGRFYNSSTKNNFNRKISNRWTTSVLYFSKEGRNWNVYLYTDVGTISDIGGESMSSTAFNNMNEDSTIFSVDFVAGALVRDIIEVDTDHIGDVLHSIARMYNNDSDTQATPASMSILDLTEGIF